MIDGIRQNLTYLEPGARKGAKSDAASSPTGPSASVSGASSAEVVEISSLATEGRAAPLDRAKIDAVRAAIQNNSYPVDFDKLAHRMVASLSGGGAAE